MRAKRNSKKLPELISADSCSEINDFHGGESSNVVPKSPKVPEPRAQGGKKGGFSIYLLRTKLLRDYVTTRLETGTKLLGD